MRDPDLVLRAERAATALEQAWMHWRARHGLAAGPLPPVSSYVGYSLEEPWGQPRVVFGVTADEAERIAGILEGHDCGGPAHSEIAVGADRRQPCHRFPGRQQPCQHGRADIPPGTGHQNGHGASSFRRAGGAGRTWNTATWPAAAAKASGSGLVVMPARANIGAPLGTSRG